MKTLKFSIVLHICENTDVFITLDENIYGIHSKRVNILLIYYMSWKMIFFLHILFYTLSNYVNNFSNVTSFILVVRGDSIL